MNDRTLLSMLTGGTPRVHKNGGPSSATAVLFLLYFALPQLCSAFESEPLIQFSDPDLEGTVTVTSMSDEYDTSTLTYWLVWKRFAGEVVPADVEAVQGSTLSRVATIEGVTGVDLTGRATIDISMYPEDIALNFDDGVYCRILKISDNASPEPSAILGYLPLRFEVVNGIPYELSSLEYDARTNEYEDGTNPDGSRSRDLVGYVEHSTVEPDAKLLEIAIANASGPIK